MSCKKNYVPVDIFSYIHTSPVILRIFYLNLSPDSNGTHWLYLSVLSNQLKWVTLAAQSTTMDVTSQCLDLFPIKPEPWRVKYRSTIRIICKYNFFLPAVPNTLVSRAWPLQGWDCSDFWLNSDFLCRPGEENQTIFFSTNKEILLIGLLL